MRAPKSVFFYDGDDDYDPNVDSENVLQKKFRLNNLPINKVDTKIWCIFLLLLNKYDLFLYNERRMKGIIENSFE